MADCGGTPIWYERRGDGAPLLYSNGSGATLESAANIVDRFADEFDVVAYDHRGMGRSPVPSAPYGMADAAADVAGLMDHLGWDRCAISGLSFGGMVAQEFAVTHPERVTRLSLMSTSPGGAHPSFPLEQLDDLPADQRADRALQLADRRWTADWLANHPDDLQIVLRLAAERPDHETDEQRAGRTAQLAARQGHDVEGRLSRITSPTLVQCGAEDGIAPRANSEAIVQEVPDATLRVHDGGHLFLFQDPSAWPTVLGFLAGATAGSTDA